VHGFAAGVEVPDYMAGDELARGALVEVMAAQRPAPMPISAVMPSARMVPPRVRVALEALGRLHPPRASA
jgi:DNA-binding transcriptional LysR family regulator